MVLVRFYCIFMLKLKDNNNTCNNILCKFQETKRAVESQSQANHLLLRVLIFEQHWVCCSDVLLVVVVADNLHVVETEVDSDTLVGRRQETQCVEGELKLRTDANEDAALGLGTILPAELQRQDVLVLIRLQTKRRKQRMRR